MPEQATATSTTRTEAGAQAPQRRKRGRPRKVESFADWMARVDAEVDTMARKVAKDPPSYAWLSAAQRRIVQMLIEHMRALPELGDAENVYDKKEYSFVNRILTNLFRAKYPEWTQLSKDGAHDVGCIPNGEGEVFKWILRNCAGRAPAEIVPAEDEG